MKAQAPSTPPLTRSIGQAERTMRALLEQQLGEAGLSFPEWTVLVFLDGAGTLALRDLIQRQVDGHVVHDATAARASVERLLSSGLLTPADKTGDANRQGGVQDDLRLSLAAAGEAVYRPIRQAVSRITDELYGDLPRTDLEATHRTLTEIARRANARLAATTELDH